jgi:hypothetical protein
MTHKTVHIPEDDEYPQPYLEHRCSPEGVISRHAQDIHAKHGTITRCENCDQHWWAHVSSRYNSYSGRILYHLEWNKVRWYHFRLKKYLK